VAIRTQELLEWDTADFRLKRGSAHATSLLKPQYRSPWGQSAESQFRNSSSHVLSEM
jgi:hypothetical protein